MDTIDSIRQQKGYLTIQETVALRESGNIIFDPYSTLISRDVSIGKNNIFYPNVVVEQKDDVSITIGDSNVFYPGTLFLGHGGTIAIGNNNEFGPAGCVIKANMADAVITIGDGGRYCDGASVMGKTSLGSGSQVLGNITVQGCSLAAGGTFKEADPDARAAVLKGFGLARGLQLEIGQVVNGAGSFADAPVEWQRSYHPKPQVKA